MSNLTESVCLVATLPWRDWVICAPAAFLPCGTRWAGEPLWQNSVYAGNKPDVRVPMLRWDTRSARSLSGPTPALRNGRPIGSSLDRWSGLPCTAPVADDSWRTRPVSTHATGSRQLSFESFLAPYSPHDLWACVLHAVLPMTILFTTTTPPFG